MNTRRSKSLDGAYTKMLRAVYNVSCQSHTTNKELYGNLPPITTIIRRRRLAMAGTYLDLTSLLL